MITDFCDYLWVYIDPISAYNQKISPCMTMNSVLRFTLLEFEIDNNLVNIIIKKSSPELFKKSDVGYTTRGSIC